MCTDNRDQTINAMKTVDGEVYAFCNVYKFSGFKNPKIAVMISYVIEVIG